MDEEIINKEKVPNYFKRNKRLLLCLLPFFIISIVLVGLYIWAEKNYKIIFANETLPLGRIVFSLVYILIMHIFCHKTNAKFSKIETMDNRLLKRDKIKNSILLIIPILLVVICSIMHFVEYINIYKFDYHYNYNVLSTIDMFASTNGFLLTSFIIYMYFKDKLNLRKNEILKPNGELDSADNYLTSNKKHKMIKNKRLISWAYIWRFILLFVFAFFVLFLVIRGNESMFPLNDYGNYQTQVDNNSISILKLLTLKLYETIPLFIIGAVSFIIILIIGTVIINHIVKKKISIEKQNIKYIKKSVFCIIALLIVIIISSVVISYLDTNVTEIKNALKNSQELYLDMRDLCELDVVGPESNSVIQSIDMTFKDFELSEFNDYYDKFVTPYFLTCIIALLLDGIIIIIITNKSMNKIVVEDTKDDNNTIIPTQDKAVKEYKIMLIIIHIVNIILAIILFSTFKVKTYVKPKYGNHELLIKSSIFQLVWRNTDDYEELDEVEEVETEEVQSEPEEEDEALLNWLKLEHEDDWYLINDINITEATKYCMTHDDYKADKEYILSKKEEAKEFGEKIMNYKSLSEAENDLKIKFIHTGFFEWTYVIDNKNLLTGTGITVKVDDFTNRIINDYKLYDRFNYFVEPKLDLEQIKEEAIIDDLYYEIRNIYADVSIEELTLILGHPFSSNKEFGIDFWKYTWYDENGNRLVVEYSDNVMTSAILYKN